MQRRRRGDERRTTFRGDRALSVTEKRITRLRDPTGGGAVRRHRIVNGLQSAAEAHGRTKGQRGQRIDEQSRQEILESIQR